MIKNLLLIIFVVLISSCSTPPKNYTSKDGAKLFTEQKYEEAVKVFKKLLEKDPTNANAAYNIALSYIELGKEVKALEFLIKTTDINPLYYFAWNDIAMIQFNRMRYKECVKAAIKGGEIAQDLLTKAYKKLEEQDFHYKNYAQIKNKQAIPSPGFIDEDAHLYLTMSVKPDGKVNEVYYCSKQKKALCDFYKPIFSRLEFIPGYNFYSDQLENSVVIASLNIKKNDNLKVEFIANEIYESSNSNPTMGALDKSQIDKYIRRALAKIRWCYERELKNDPTLNGRIVISFTIDGSGSVILSETLKTTMKNETVETCLSNQIKKIKFPAPKGGGIVIVNYPFVFRHSEN